MRFLSSCNASLASDDIFRNAEGLQPTLLRFPVAKLSRCELHKPSYIVFRWRYTCLLEICLCIFSDT